MAGTERLAVQVCDAGDLAAALRGLRGARRELIALLGERSPGTDPDELEASVSPAVQAPGGPLLVVTAPGLDEDSTLELIAGRVRQAGERHGHVAPIATGGPLDHLESVPDAVVLRLFPTPLGTDGALHADWLDVAADWTLGDLHGLDPVRVRILGIELEVPAPDAVQVLQDCLAARAWCDIVHGDLDDRLRTVSLTFGPLPHLALAGGGPGAGEDGLLARFEVLRDAARELAGSVTWSCLTIDRTFGSVATGLTELTLPGGGWVEHGGAPPNAVAAWLVDEHLPDVYAHQVLSPGHIRQLGHVPESGEALGDGRVEVAVGDPADWLPGSVPTEAYEAARYELAPLLVTDRAFDGLVADRVGPLAPEAAPTLPPARSEPTVGQLTELEHLPALDAIVLEPAPHRHRSSRLTLLELVAWLDDQAHTDHPEHVSAPIGTFARWLAVGLDDQRRQGLRDRAPSLVGTAAAPALERARAWRVTRWLVQVQAASWLRRAGMVDIADRLLAVDLADARGQARATEALGRAAVAANRRLSMTAELVYADRGETDRLAETERLDDAAWEAWELVNGPAGWVAAAEAAVADLPGEVAAAADQRVIEVVRQRGTADPAIDPGALANEVWSVALVALADHLWSAGWRAAGQVAAGEANVDLAGPALGTTAEIWDALDDDDRTAAAAAAHEAARGPLARAGLDVGDAGGVDAPGGLAGHPWDVATGAAAAAAGTGAWRTALDEVRLQLGERTWAEAMEAARAAVDDVIGAGPDLIARARLVALAREASGAAARVVAAEAVAVARTSEADDRALVEAAAEALRPVAELLAGDAEALLDRLLHDEPDPVADPSIGAPPRSGERRSPTSRRVRTAPLTATTASASARAS
jgi:hypothetical protein